jgi:hypothetical protein
VADVRFSAVVEPAGNATGVEVPAAVVDALGSGRRPKVVITIGGHTWRSRVASMGGRFIVGISAANRAASGISEGDVTEVDLQLDDEPRVVAEPPDLAAALDQAPRARAAFDLLPYGLKNKDVRDIEGAKSPETRQRRIAKLVTAMSGGRDA